MNKGEEQKPHWYPQCFQVGITEGCWDNHELAVAVCLQQWILSCACLHGIFQGASPFLLHYNANQQVVHVQKSQWPQMRREPLNLPLHLHWYWGFPASLFDQAVCSVLLCVRVCVRLWPCMTTVNGHLSITGTRARDFQEPGLILSRTTCRETTWFSKAGEKRHRWGRNVASLCIQRHLYVYSRVLHGIISAVGKTQPRNPPRPQKKFSSHLFIFAQRHWGGDFMFWLKLKKTSRRKHACTHKVSELLFKTLLFWRRLMWVGWMHTDKKGEGEKQEQW